jgi:hypothetical protein
MNEQEQFLKDLERNEDEDPFAALNTPEEEEKTEEEDEPENQPEEIKNRRHRRLEEKLQAEREANIALNARVEALAEATRSKESPDFLSRIERIYGTDSPEAVAATELLKQSFLDVKEEAKRELREELRQEQLQRQAEEKKEAAVLDSMLEELEDEHGIDLTSPKSEATRKGFFRLLEKMSPKDSTGTVIAYADHHAVWEEYRSKVAKKPDTRAKDLASRTMVQSGASKESNLQDDATLRFLKDNGLI